MHYNISPYQTFKGSIKKATILAVSATAVLLYEVLQEQLSKTEWRKANFNFDRRTKINN